MSTSDGDASSVFFSDLDSLAESDAFRKNIDEKPPQGPDFVVERNFADSETVQTNFFSVGSLCFSVNAQKQVWWPYHYLVSSGIIHGRRIHRVGEWTAQADVFFGWLAGSLTDSFNAFVVSWPLVESFF